MRVFISFRPGVTQAAFVDRLAAALIGGAVTETVRSPSGQAPVPEYPARAAAAIARCDAFLALIGAGWADVAGPQGRLIDDPLDPVRVEIVAGLDRIMPLVPVLIDGASLPDASRITRALQGLSLRDSVDLHAATMEDDLPKLLALVAPARNPSEVAGTEGRSPGLHARLVSLASGHGSQAEARASRSAAATRARVPSRRLDMLITLGLLGMALFAAFMVFGLVEDAFDALGDLLMRLS